MRLFFAAGLNHAKLKDNINILLATARRATNAQKTSEEDLHLAHLLMPSYFADAPELQGDDKRLNAFLQESAQFYQTTYQEATNNRSYKPAIDVHLIIPKRFHIKNAVAQGDALDKHKANITVLHKELVQKVGTNQKYVLINQNGPEMAPMVEELREHGATHVTQSPLPIYNDMGHLSTIFTPYILKPDRTYDYKTSPLFTKALLTYVQKKCKGGTPRE